MIIPKHWQSWYERLDCDFPGDWDGKTDVKSRLNGKDERQRYGAAFELYLYCLLKDKGLEVEFHPGVESADPDFLIRDMRGQNVYVEAGALFNHPLEAIGDHDKLASTIREKLNQIKSRDFFWNCLRPSGNPGNVRQADVVSKVRDWVNNVSPNADCWELEETFMFGEWELRVRMEPKTLEDKEKYGDDMYFLIGEAGFSGGYSDYPQERLKTKLEEKSKQAGKAGGLSIVALTGRYEYLRNCDIQDALYGGNKVCMFDLLAKRLDAPYLRGMNLTQPNQDGFWCTDGSSDRTIAVLMHQGNLTRYPCDEPQLWLSPKASYWSVPIQLLSLDIYGLKQEIWSRKAQSGEILNQSS